MFSISDGARSLPIISEHDKPKPEGSGTSKIEHLLTCPAEELFHSTSYGGGDHSIQSVKCEATNQTAISSASGDTQGSFQTSDVPEQSISVTALLQQVCPPTLYSFRKLM